MFIYSQLMNRACNYKS